MSAQATASADLQAPDSRLSCVVCGRTGIGLMAWFGCASSCGLCAAFFRRICIGERNFVQPEECPTGFRLEH
jgi:hypothetical protein